MLYARWDAFAAAGALIRGDRSRAEDAGEAVWGWSHRDPLNGWRNLTTHG